jgi:hypothetical protein
MPMTFQNERIVLQGVVAVEEAEKLLEVLHQHPLDAVDASACTHLHTANLQILMAARPKICAWPIQAQLRTWLESIFGGAL